MVEFFYKMSRKPLHQRKDDRTCQKQPDSMQFPEKENDPGCGNRIADTERPINQPFICKFSFFNSCYRYFQSPAQESVPEKEPDQFIIYFIHLEVPHFAGQLFNICCRLRILFQQFFLISMLIFFFRICRTHGCTEQCPFSSFF